LAEVERTGGDKPNNDIKEEGKMGVKLKTKKM